jgi:hypothetical protein
MPAGVRCALIPTAFGLRETHERERRQNRAARGSRLAPAFCARCDAVVDSRADHDARLGAGARLPQLLAAGLPLAHAFAASRQRALRERRPRAGISGSRVLRARAALAIRGVEAVLLRGARGFAWRRARPQDSSCSSRGSRREQGAARMSVYDVESEAVHGGVWVPRSSRSRPRCAVVDHGPDRDARLAVGAPSHISRRFSPRARRRRPRRGVSRALRASGDVVDLGPATTRGSPRTTVSCCFSASSRLRRPRRARRAHAHDRAFVAGVAWACAPSGSRSRVHGRVPSAVRPARAVPSITGGPRRAAPASPARPASPASPWPSRSASPRGAGDALTRAIRAVRLWDALVRARRAGVLRRAPHRHHARSRHAVRH